MNYLIIGTNTISPELFLEIKNTTKIKPTGGLWATTYNTNYANYNEWADYLCDHPHLLFYRRFDNPYLLAAIYFTLNDNANIFTIDSAEKIAYLKTNYPFNNWFDYEKLAQHYDGIFIDLYSLQRTNHEINNILFSSFSVSTLILFNTNCIKHYQNALIDLTNIDFGAHEFPEYSIKIDEEIHKIEKPSIEILTLMEIIKKYIETNNIKPTPENFEKIKKIFQRAINEALKYYEIPQKDMLLVRKVFNQF